MDSSTELADRLHRFRQENVTYSTLVLIYIPSDFLFGPAHQYIQAEESMQSLLPKSFESQDQLPLTGTSFAGTLVTV
jgi:hypothetical protein